MNAMHAVQGQRRVVELLQTQLSAGRMHHGYIFHGPAGVGKFTTALALARILLCHDRQTNLTGQVEACGNCESCRLLDAKPQAVEGDDDAQLRSPHPDLHVVTKELARYNDDAQIRQRKLTRIPVEVLRAALIEPVYRAAALRHGKVFIVDEAELLNPAGQNLLLKTLEEPPPNTTIILVTSSEDRLLPTIRSRCQRVAFTPIPEELVAAWADEHADGLGAKQRQWLIGFADGSFGRAQLALEYDLSEWAEAVLPKVDRLAEGKSSGELGGVIAERINTFAEAWVKGHANASKEAANKLAASLMWSMIATHVRQKIAALSKRCDPADPFTGEAILEPWLGVIDALTDAERLLASNVNLGLVCNHLVMNMDRSLTPVSA